MEELMQIDFRKTEFLAAVAEISKCPYQIYPEIVLAGRSNVGKSSFINSLGQNKTLAKTSSTPGKTKLVIYFLADKAVLLTDLPGYGFTKTSKEKQAGYSSLADSYFTSGRNISFVIHFMDIRHAPSKEDLMMKSWLDENKVRYFVVLSKADKLNRLEIKQRLADFKSEINLADDVPVIPLSSKSKEGMDEIKSTIRKWVDCPK
jgi:GTP-binding protein